jgi:hypothetical protein
MEEQQKTLREEAMAYEPPQTLNIADLSEVPIDDFKIAVKESQDSEGKAFSYKYFVKDGKEYRVPNTVLEEIKKILKLKSDVKKVKVKKSGSGLATRYEVDVVA